MCAAACHIGVTAGVTQARLMSTAIWAAKGFCLLTTGIHLLTTLIAIIRCRSLSHALPAAPAAPGVTVIRPVCGLENHIGATLRSAFALDYPCYEVVFCVANARDPVVPLVRRLIAAHPQVPARLLVGDDRISDNPKLNNVYKGWRQARYDWTILADSNVRMPADYIQRLMSAWRPDTGLVCSPPVGCHPRGFWAELECAFLNGYQARFQYAADSLGFGFAQGKTMLWRRSLIEPAGGVRALAAELAEDAASTKIVRGLGLRVRLVDAPFEQPLGRRTAMEVWRRQLRWARLRRASFKSWFALEILSGGALPSSAAAVLVLQGELPSAALPALVLIWYGSEALLARAAAWQLSPSATAAYILRDLLLPALWISAWLGNAFVWRGNHMQTAESKSFS
jgi:ceramide glucosyltransferase